MRSGVKAPPLSPPRGRVVSSSGFTNIELVVVLILIGVLSAVVLPRLSGRITYDTRGYADQVRGALEYAQKTAVAQRRYVCAAVAGGSLSLSKSTSYSPAPTTVTCTVALLDPTTGSTFDLAAPAGVTVSASVSPVIFDALGQNVDAAGTPRSTDVTVSVSGDFSTTFTVEKVTGYAR